MASATNLALRSLSLALRTVLAGVIIGAMSVAFAISFAAVVYIGPAADFLASSIALTLTGAALMALIGALVYRFHGMLCQPQETTAILLAGAVGGMTAGLEPAAAGPTTAALVAATAAFAGLTAYLCGRFRLGNLARFVPYPVLGGFLVASGYVLLAAGMGLVLHAHLDIWSAGALIAPEAAGRWLPWFCVAAGLVAVLRIVRHELALPAALLGIAAGFYAFLALTGRSLDEAMAAGLLLGPFPDGSAYPGPMTLVADADWGAVLSQLPTILAVAGLTVLGTLLNTSGLELTLGRHTDINRDLGATGIVNLVASFGGGLPGYPMIGETLLGIRLGLKGMSAGIAVAVVCAAAAVYGAQLLALLPLGLFASVITYLGLDLLITWLWFERRRLSRWDFGIILSILFVAAVVGFVEAIAVGLAVAAIIFTASYARLDVVRRSSTAALRRSIVERPQADLELLAREGDRALILELGGFLFFGTANTLLERVRAELARGDRTDLVIDFAAVSGIDTSAIRTLGRICALCRASPCRLTFSGMQPAVEARWQSAAGGNLPVMFAPALDDVLLFLEEEILARTDARPQVLGLLDEVRRAVPEADLDALLTEVRLAAGETLIAEGAISREIFVLDEGALRAEVRRPGGGRMVVARFLPGAVVGEIALYAGLPRTAEVIAETTARVTRIDAAMLDHSHAPLAAAFHKAIASRLAGRLNRTTQLLRHATF